MQIIAGKARGLNLAVPQNDAVRPTPVRARKALFDSLGPWDERHVLDLFAGSGALGLEALSRNARSATFVEQSAAHRAILEKNCQAVQKTGIEGQIRIIGADVFTLNAVAPETNFIFADPPYAQTAAYCARLLESKVLSAVAADCFFVWEIPPASPEMKAFAENAFWQRAALRNYGSVCFLILRRKNEVLPDSEKKGDFA